MNSLELTGRARTHVVDLTEPPCSVHVEAVAAYVALRRAAGEAGHDLVAVSSFRDFDHQVQIWNAKFRGERPMFDAYGLPVEAAGLTEAERVAAILLWSALPGASRHHWGSEIDVIDRRAAPEGYRPQLLPAEFEPGGPFAPLNLWLEEHLAEFGFFRPYRTDRGGVRPEPWHLSYAPVAVPSLDALTVDVLAEALQAPDILGRDTVLARLPDLHRRYVRSVDLP